MAIEGVLRASPRVWCVTGVAGFIGSHLLQRLLSLGQEVIGLDNFATGHPANLDDVRLIVGSDAWSRFQMVEGDVRDLSLCRKVISRANYVLHQAALGSVPRSLSDPMATHDTNINGFLNVLHACKEAAKPRLVYAASSSTYGDHPALPKKEEIIGKPLSPYAVTKYVNEIYADVYGRCYETVSIGLRYFNVFGARQDPNGAYAAVIPKWFSSLKNNEGININGDGETSRDFCYVDNVVEANILAATVADRVAFNEIYNVAYGERTTLNNLFLLIRNEVARFKPRVLDVKPNYGDFRPGDVRHSQADIKKAKRLLGYEPAYSLARGLSVASDWYLCGD